MDKIKESDRLLIFFNRYAEALKKIKRLTDVNLFLAEQVVALRGERDEALSALDDRGIDIGQSVNYDTSRPLRVATDIETVEKFLLELRECETDAQSPVKNEIVVNPDSGPGVGVMPLLPVDETVENSDWDDVPF